MSKRKIIEIERELCDGCGLCTTACMEGALAIDEENKAVLVKEIYCDGMGACLDVCPTGALRIVERDSDAYDSKATYRHVLETRGKDAAKQVHGAETGGHTPHGGRTPAAHFSAGCPGSRAVEISRDEAASPSSAAATVAAAPIRSELSQWPIQLHLVSPLAPYFENSDLLIAADCTAFALGGFHSDLLKGKKLVIACPKLDDTEGYVEKLADLIKRNSLKSLTVAIMTVPCCSGLWRMVEDAVERSGVAIEPMKVVIGIEGKIA
jgi:NAD-dependent dihydropyrimidine dehydrogenase PreA subunit